MIQVKLLDICDVYQPQTISTKQFVKDGKYLVYGANGVIGRYSKYNHKDSEVVMGCRGACGAIHISLPYSWINGNAMVIHPNGKMPLSKKYLQYFMIFANKDSIISGTAQPQITRQNMKDFTIPICSVESQERIVSRIEELFSELDNGVETLKKTKEQLAVYRQAVLKEAFEGTLTHTKPYSIEKLRTFIETPRYGTSKKCSSDIIENGIAVYRIPNIDHGIGRISHDDLKYAVFSKDELEGIKLRIDDILIIRSNGSASLVGRAAMVCDNDINGTFAGYLMRLRIKNTCQLNPRFLLLFLQSSSARVYIERVAKSTSGVHNINSKEVSDLNIPLFTYDEQRDIIRAIESRLSVCDSIEKTIDIALQQAEVMRQSILKKAFEGGLK